jgi:hypothetical protein
MNTRLVFNNPRLDPAWLKAELESHARMLINQAQHVEEPLIPPTMNFDRRDLRGELTFADYDEGGLGEEEDSEPHKPSYRGAWTHNELPLIAPTMDFDDED